MGWTFTHRPKGMTTEAFFVKEFPTMLQERGQILASAMKDGVFYAAVHNKDTDEVWALVCLTQRSKQYHNFGYKDMSDSMGPCYYDAPAKVLDLLTPTDSEYANQWRAECRLTLARAAMLPKVTRGTTLRFTRAMKFTSGEELDTFTFVERSTFERNGQRYRIPSWKSFDFEVVA